MDALSLEQQLPYAFFTQAGSQQPPPPQPQPPPPPPPASQQQPPPPSQQVPVGLPSGGPLMPSNSLTRGPQLPPLSVTVPSSLPQSPPDNPGQPPMGIDITSVSPGWGLWGLTGGSCMRSPGLWEAAFSAQGPRTVGCPATSAAVSGFTWRQTCQGLGLKQTLLGPGYSERFLPGIFKPRFHLMYAWGN